MPQKKYLDLEERQQNKIQPNPIIRLKKLHTSKVSFSGLEFGLGKV